MSEILRRCLTDAPSIREVSRETGVERRSLFRFLKGGGITLASADRLARYFGFELKKTKGNG
jgi:hypothetical protein